MVMKDISVFKSIGLSNYMIDKILLLTGGSSSTGSGSVGEDPIIVKVGTSEATAIGIINGGSTAVSPLFVNQSMLLFVNNGLIPGEDPGLGDPYFTKVKANNNFTVTNRDWVTDDWVIIVIL